MKLSPRMQGPKDTPDKNAGSCIETSSYGTTAGLSSSLSSNRRIRPSLSSTRSTADASTEVETRVSSSLLSSSPQGTASSSKPMRFVTDEAVDSPAPVSKRSNRCRRNLTSLSAASTREGERGQLSDGRMFCEGRCRKGTEKDTPGDFDERYVVPYQPKGSFWGELIYHRGVYRVKGGAGNKLNLLRSRLQLTFITVCVWYSHALHRNPERISQFSSSWSLLFKRIV